MKKIISLCLAAVFVVSVAFSQTLPKIGVENTLWTGFGQQYPEGAKLETPNVRYYGLYETLQARIDISQFTVEGMLNWAAETNWKFNDFGGVHFVNTQKTPFYYTNHSEQGGEHTTGLTDSYYVNFVWNALAKDKHDLDFGMGTRLSWKIGPAPNCNGYYWEPYTHIVQGGLKEGAPGTADVVGYTNYDNVYANHALGIRYRYDDFIEAGISLPSGVTTDKMFFNAAFAIQPMDVFRVGVAFEDVGKDSTDFYSGLSLYFSKVTVDAYLEIQDIGSNADEKTWGTGATVTWYPIKNLMVKPEGGVSFYRTSNYTPAFYAGGRLEWTINNQLVLGGFSSLAFGSRNQQWEKIAGKKDWHGGFIFDARPDFTFIIDKKNTLTATIDYQYRNSYSKKDYSVWASGVYWTYKN